MQLRHLVPLCLIAACGEGAGGDSEDEGADAAAAPPVEAVCDDVTGRAVVEGEFACPGEPEAVTVMGRYRYEIFKYEASHPLATAELAFPCASSTGRAFEAPRQTSPACSRAGVKPWHSVRWDDADRACKAAGTDWRLCTGEELARACAGPDGWAYTYGATFDNGRCNLRESYAPGGKAGEAPSGALDGCVSAEGAYDLTGNLWEWSRDVDADDGATRIAYGAGWRTIPQRHTENFLVCDTQNVVPGISARSYANPDMGFRCCRDFN